MARVSTRLAKWIEWLIRVFEIILSMFLIVGVVSAGLMMVFSLHGVFVSGTDSSFQRFLDDALLYIIGLEVALMLIKRDPHLVTDILIFAIARKMIVTMQSGVDFFLGALAILLLYIVKCYGISCILLPRQLLSNFTKHYYAAPEPAPASPQGAAPEPAPASHPNPATESTPAAAHANSDDQATANRASVAASSSVANSLQAESSTNS